MSAITRVSGYHTCHICGWPDQKVKMLQYNAVNGHTSTIYVCGGCEPRLAATIDRINQRTEKQVKQR